VMYKNRASFSRMAESCCGTLMKWGLSLINVLFGLLGLAMLGIGGYIYKVVGDYSTVEGDSFLVVPIFLLCVGAFTFILAIFGCLGVGKENPCLTWTYAIIMIILVICEISAGITAVVKKDDVSRALVNIAEDSMNSWDDPMVQSTWASIQTSFDCCGVESYTDWSNKTITDGSFVTWAKDHGWNADGPAPNNTEYPVPDSCCVTFNGTENSCGFSYNLLHVEDELRPAGSNQGCADGLTSWVQDNLGLVAGVAAGIAVIEILGIVCAIYLLRSDNGYERFTSTMSSYY